MVSRKMVYIIFIGIFIILSFAFNSYAGCTIKLKNGRVIEPKYCEESGDMIFYHKYGSRIGVAKSQVDSLSIETDENTVEEGSGEAPFTVTKIKEDIREKYGVQFRVSSFTDEKSYRRDVEPLLTLQEQYLYVNHFINEKSKIVAKTKKKYEYMQTHDPTKARIEGFQRHERAKQNLFKAEMAVNSLINYTKSKSESIKFVSQYTDEQLEQFKEAEYNFYDSKMNVINSKLDEINARLVECKRGTSKRLCNKKRLDHLNQSRERYTEQLRSVQQEHSAI